MQIKYILLKQNLSLELQTKSKYQERNARQKVLSNTECPKKTHIRRQLWWPLVNQFLAANCATINPNLFNLQNPSISYRPVACYCLCVQKAQGAFGACALYQDRPSGTVT